MAQCVNKESSSERRNYVGQGQTDLLYVNANDLIQSRRIQIRVASLSLASFRHLSVCWWPTYILYQIYHLFPCSKYIILFSLQLVGQPEFRLWRWNMTFSDTEMIYCQIWHFQTDFQVRKVATLRAFTIGFWKVLRVAFYFSWPGSVDPLAQLLAWRSLLWLSMTWRQRYLKQVTQSSEMKFLHSWATFSTGI